MCSRTLLSVLTAAFVVFGVLYQLYVLPVQQMAGYGRVVTPAKKGLCRTHTKLQACRKLVFYEPMNIVFAACGEPDNRRLWSPQNGHTNKTGAGKDYLATWHPNDDRSDQLLLNRFNAPFGLSAIALDVVGTNEKDPRQSYAFVLNVRAEDEAGGVKGVIEILKSDAIKQPPGIGFTHFTTLKDPLIGLPSDIIGSADGRSAFITNDVVNKSSFGRFLDILFRRENTFITYCHVENGCKVVARRLKTSNGIARGQNGEIYVSHTYASEISVFEEQSDHSLVLTDTIPVNGGALDGISVDADGAIWVAEYPKVFTSKGKAFKNRKQLAPSSVLKITLNTEESSFYGQKYKIEKVFEDNGKVANGITSVVHDTKRKKLYMHGLLSPRLVWCPYK